MEIGTTSSLSMENPHQSTTEQYKKYINRGFKTEDRKVERTT